MSYIGTEPKDIRSFGRTKFDYTATQGQTAFTGADDDGKVLAFTVGQIEVYVNGILMDDSDFTTTGTGTVTLATAANLNDVINIVSFETNIPDSNYVPATGGTFSGDVDFGANKITYANIYAQLSDLPSASTYHGMFAHVHATGLAYYAHAGAWIPLAKGLGIDDNATSTAMTLDSSGDVGIGNTVASSMVGTGSLTIGSGVSGQAAAYTVYSNSDTYGALYFADATSGTARYAGGVEYNHTNDRLSLSTNATGRLFITSNGNVGIGTTENVSLATTEEGFWYQANDWMAVSRSGGKVAYFNRLSSDGEVLEIRRNGSPQGVLGANGGYLYVGSGNVNLRFHNGADAILPATSSGSSRDNVIDMGTSGARFDNIYATNSSIQTSDETEKQDIASLTSAEITAATAISKLFKTYKWKDKVAAKGDDARTHTGVIAQQVQTAMADAGLDASKYAFWCSDTWTNDDGNEQTRMGVRYPELLAFVGAATEQRLTNIETRLAALEGG